MRFRDVNLRFSGMVYSGEVSAVGRNFSNVNDVVSFFDGGKQLRAPALLHDFEHAAQRQFCRRRIQALEHENRVLSRLVRETRAEIDRLQRRLTG